MAVRDPPTVVAVLVVATLLLTGPLVGTGTVQPRPTTIGDGTATVSHVAIDTSQIRITDGWFGTDVRYLRVPDATVTVDSVTGRPRLLYQIEVPGLGISLEDERLLSAGQSGTYRLSPGDQGINPPSVERDEYVGTVRLRVQSFEQDTTVFATNVTVRVIE